MVMVTWMIMVTWMVMVQAKAKAKNCLALTYMREFMELESSGFWNRELLRPHPQCKMLQTLAQGKSTFFVFLTSQSLDFKALEK